MAKQKFAPSSIQKFAYQYTHKNFKTAVISFYKPIERIGYRIVSEKCDEKDFVPIITNKIEQESKISKKHIDERSLSFYTNVEACHQNAISIYNTKKRKFGVIEADLWKNGHTHIAEVYLTKEDGYMDIVPIGYHFNFAPFLNFKISQYPMTIIDYNVHEMYYLQTNGDTPYVTINFRDNGECYLQVRNENERHIPHRVVVSPRDIVKYMRKRITIVELCKKKGISISSKLEIYQYYSDKYVIDEESITENLFYRIYKSTDMRDKLFRFFCFRTPRLN